MALPQPVPAGYEDTQITTTPKRRKLIASEEADAITVEIPESPPPVPSPSRVAIPPPSTSHQAGSLEPPQAEAAEPRVTSAAAAIAALDDDDYDGVGAVADSVPPPAVEEDPLGRRT